MATRYIMHIHEWASIRSCLMYVKSARCLCSRFQLCAFTGEKNDYEKYEKKATNETKTMVAGAAATTKIQRRKHTHTCIYINRFMKLKLIISIYANVHLTDA